MKGISSLLPPVWLTDGIFAMCLLLPGLQRCGTRKENGSWAYSSLEVLSSSITRSTGRRCGVTASISVHPAVFLWVPGGLKHLFTLRAAVVFMSYYFPSKLPSQSHAKMMTHTHMLLRWISAVSFGLAPTSGGSSSFWMPRQRMHLPCASSCAAETVTNNWGRYGCLKSPQLFARGTCV